MQKSSFVGRICTVALVLLTLPLNVALALNLNSVEAYGTDTIAGYTALLQTSQTYPHQEVIFNVQKPDSTNIVIPSKTNESGIAKVDFPDYHTRQAGQYYVSVFLNESNITSEASSFVVYPDKVSAEKSSLSVNRSVIQADGIDQISAQVTLADQYGNPYPGHLVNLIPSRTRDIIKVNSPSGVSDNKGIITFSVTSGEAGVSTLTAIDSTTNTILAQRVSVAFLAKNQYLKDIGGNDVFNSFIQTAKAAGSGSLHHFEISDLPVNIQAGQNINFKITAKDETNQAVQNYTGKIHFSAEGSNSENISLPEDYNFKAEDLGSHQFSLGLSFPKNGSYKIIVNDLNNSLLKGEKTITVGNSQNGNSQQTLAENLKPTIDTPTPGTYSQKQLTINGTAPAGYSVKIFDNEQEIGSVQVTNSGKYTYQTNPLSDGKHVIYVITLDGTQSVKGTSQTVEITIDTTPPTVDEIKLTPNSNVKPEEAIQVDITSEENLSQAALVFNSDIAELSPDIEKPGHYIASILAPKTPGIYPIDVVVVDELGNEGSYKAKGQVTVTGGSGSENEFTKTTEATNPLSEIVDYRPPVTTAPPSKVTGIITYGDNKKVTLVWDAATDNTQVENYRIYYGQDAGNLRNHVDTKDASTTWYIPNLENGKQYYFAIAAFDSEGNEGLKGEVTTGIPYMSEVTNLPKTTSVFKGPLNFPGLAEFNNTLHAAAFQAGVLPKVNPTGPELFWILSGSGLASLIHRKIRRNKK